MKLFPIAERELRVASRRAGTYWLRFFVVAALILISTWAYLVTGRLQPQMVGRTLFYTLAGGVMLYVMLSGLRSTADSLSEEKREGTLGLLFLTDLRGYDVVLGKLLANSLSMFYCVLSVLPVLAVPLLMGGVTVAEFARLVLVIVNTLFFSLSAGMLASALSKSPRVAISWTMMLLLLVSAGGPVAGMVEWWMRNWRGSYAVGFLFTSPVFSFFAGVDEYYRSGFGKGYIIALVFVHLVSCLFLILASLIVPKSWQDKPSTINGMKLRARVRDVVEGEPPDREKFRTKCLDQNAFFWLATKPKQKVFWAWIPFGLVTVGWIWGALKVGDDWFNPAIYAATVIILGLSLKAMIAAESGNRLLEDRKSGALELLLATPLTVGDIVRGQRLAIQRQFGLLFKVILVLGIGGWLLGASHQDINISERRYWLWGGVLGLIVFVADCVALFWMGMWEGLSAKNPRHAFGSTVVPILALPWILMGLTMTGIELLPPAMKRAFRFEAMPMLLWFVFSLMADLIFGLSARYRLLKHFRHVAAQRFQPALPVWRRLFERVFPKKTSCG